MVDLLPRPGLVQGSHQLVHELGFLFSRNPLHPAAHVEWVLQESFVIGSEVYRQRQGRLWSDACTSCVQGELPNGNAHAIDAKVSKTQDARAVGYNSDLDI